MPTVPVATPARHGTHGRVLVVDLSEGASHVEAVEESVYRQFLAGYGLGAWLMWKHYPPQAEPLAPASCFAVVSGLLTGAHAPFSGRVQIVGKSPLTGTWADSNSGGSVAKQLRQAGYDALLVKGRAPSPTVLAIQDETVALEPAGELWGKEIPETFDALRARHGKTGEVGVSAIGPAGEIISSIAVVMNDRYHAFGRQGFGAIFGSKNLKAIVVGGGGEVPVAEPTRFRALCDRINQEYKSDVGWLMRLMVWLSKPKRRLGRVYRAMTRLGIKIDTPRQAMRQLWADRGTTVAVALSIENGDSPLKNWRGVGARGAGCGGWLRHGVARAAKHLGKGSDRFAVHVHGQEPAYHDTRFSSLMGATYVADPTPGRHTAGGASWNETFGVDFPLAAAVERREVSVSWHGTAGKGVAQAHFSNAHQVMNGLGLGLCLFTTLIGGLPWLDLVNALTGWGMTERELLACGERIQALRNAFNLREGLVPSDFVPYPRMLGEGDGLLAAGPLRGVTVPLEQLRRDYYAAMRWDPATGRLARARAEELGIADLLAGYLAA